MTRYIVTVFQNCPSPTCYDPMEAVPVAYSWSFLCRSEEGAIKKAEELAQLYPMSVVRYGRYTDQISYIGSDPFKREEL